jgi:hypothetical protein
MVYRATANGLPGLMIAQQALLGVATKRSPAEVLAAAEELAGDLSEARAAIQRSGRTPDRSEIEAGATALGLGVDGAAISQLASSPATSARSLAVPIAVLGALVNRGLSSDGAIKAVWERMQNGADNTELVEMPGEAGRLLAEGMRPGDVGLALASRITGGLPAGPPSNVPRNNGLPGSRPPVSVPVPVP